MSSTTKYNVYVRTKRLYYFSFLRCPASQLFLFCSDDFYFSRPQNCPDCQAGKRVSSQLGGLAGRLDKGTGGTAVRPAHLTAFPPAHWPVCLPTRLLTRLPARFPTYSLAYLPVYPRAVYKS